MTVEVSRMAPESSLKLCSPCIQLSEQGLNILLNEILNVGVVGGCNKLCSGNSLSRLLSLLLSLFVPLTLILSMILSLVWSLLLPLYFKENQDLKICSHADSLILSLLLSLSC